MLVARSPGVEGGRGGGGTGAADAIVMVALRFLAQQFRLLWAPPALFERFADRFYFALRINIEQGERVRAQGWNANNSRQSQQAWQKQRQTAVRIFSVVPSCCRHCIVALALWNNYM